MSPRQHWNKDRLEDFTEAEIRSQILGKVDPQYIDKKGRHWLGFIFVDGKLITKVTIPNHHKDRIASKETSKNIAQELLLDPFQFNNLVKCPLKKRRYYRILKKFI